MSTHSTLHAPPSSPTEPPPPRRLIWHYGPANPSPRGGWDAVAEITSPERFAGTQQWGHGGTREEALAELRQLVDSYEAMVGVGYEADADGFARRAGGAR